MSYIGNTQQNQSYVPAVDFFSGNGSTTAFTLSKPVATTAQIQAVISNVPQTPGVAYTVSGSTITFTSAPPSGTNNIYVYYTSPNTQVVQPGHGTVGATQIDGNYALWNKVGNDVTYTAGNVGIGTNPSAWSGFSGKSLQLAFGSLFNDTPATFGYTSNAYYAGGWKYVGAGKANVHQATDGAYYWFGTNTTGSAGGAISLTENMRLDASANLLFNSGYGSVATAYGCRAWVNFNGTGTVAIRASGNVSSITDNGTGDYTLNFSAAMADANYCAVGSCIGGTGTNNNGQFVNSCQTGNPADASTTNLRFRTQWADGGLPNNDVDCISISVFR